MKYLAALVMLFYLLCSTLALAEMIEPPTPPTLAQYKLSGPVISVRKVSQGYILHNGRWEVDGQAPSFTTTQEFDMVGRLQLEIRRSLDGEYVERYEYDDAGRVKMHSINPPPSEPGCFRPILNWTYTYQYNPQGRLESEICIGTTPALELPPRADGTRPKHRDYAPLVSSTSYSYDNQGHRVMATTTNADGKTRSLTRWKYDTDGRELTSVTTNQQGVVTTRYSACYEPDGGKTLEWVNYDDWGKLISREVERLDAQGRRHEYVVTRLVEGGEETTRKTVDYTAHGKMSKQVTSRKIDGKVINGGTITDYYDMSDNLLLLLHEDDDGLRAMRSYTYDNHGNCTSETGSQWISEKYMPEQGWRTDYLQQLRTYTYDLHGNWTTETHLSLDRDASDFAKRDSNKVEKREMVTRTITYRDQQ